MRRYYRNKNMLRHKQHYIMTVLYLNVIGELVNFKLNLTFFNYNVINYTKYFYYFLNILSKVILIFLSKCL